jgi:HSP20 family protein
MTEERAVQRWPEFFDLVPRRFVDWLAAPGLELERELKVEEFVEKDEYVIRAEMPGIDPDKDVNVHVRNHSLEVRAERKQETKTEEGKGYRTEFRYGSFFRRVPLPPDANEQDVTATYRDGILEVRLPVEKKQAEATKIAIQRA